MYYIFFKLVSSFNYNSIIISKRGGKIIYYLRDLTLYQSII